MPDPAQQFLTPASLAVFPTATGAVFAVTVGLRRLTGINTPWVPFVTSMLVAAVLAASGTIAPASEHWEQWQNTLVTWSVALLNGFMLFCAVVGANEGATQATLPKPAGVPRAQGRGPRTWFASLFS